MANGPTRQRPTLRHRLTRRWLPTAGLLGLGIWQISGCASFGGTPDPDVMARLARTATYADGEFINAMPTPSGMENMGSILWDTITLDAPTRPEANIQPGSQATTALATPPASGLRLTWVGHSTVLIEIDGVRVLTDPIWSERASPVHFAGPERFAPPPLPLEALPPIDAVIISHDHYDHLDEQTIVKLASTGTRFIVPLGVEAHLARWSVPPDQVQSLDWWGRASVRAPDGRPVELVATPARHFSGRGLTDRNETLWASWVVRGPEHRVYFGGDTGLFDGFAEIGAREGPFDATLMPIGAYDARWSAIHLNPEEAVTAHTEVQGGLLLPIHWGTFDLAFHAWYEPTNRLIAAARAADVPVVVPRHGRPVEPADPPPLEIWWPHADGPEA